MKNIMGITALKNEMGTIKIVLAVMLNVFIHG
jgi:hypothetical protein